MIKAHELARRLLAGPDLTVRFQDEESAYSGFVEKVDDNPGEFCECDNFPEDTEDDENTPWEACVTLGVGSTDTILRGDSIVEH
jgi:hypothetical protein